jgi:hypothetical protein
VGGRKFEEILCSFIICHLPTNLFVQSTPSFADGALARSLTIPAPNGQILRQSHNVILRHSRRILFLKRTKHEILRLRAQNDILVALPDSLELTVERETDV